MVTFQIVVGRIALQLVVQNILAAQKRNPHAICPAAARAFESHSFEVAERDGRMVEIRHQ